MKSKIRVEFDLDSKEPYLQLYIDDTCPPNEQADMRDQMLRHFVQKASDEDGLRICYSPLSSSNDHPQIRIRPDMPKAIRYLSDEEKLELNHIIINAEYLQDWGDNHEPYEKGKSYNVMFSTGEDNAILVKDSGHVVRTDSFRKYHSLFQFISYWKVNAPYGY